MIEAVASIFSGGNALAAAPAAEKAETVGSNFSQWMVEQVSDVNDKIATAQTAFTQLATGEGGNLHQVMLQIEEAKLAFQLTVQVRNKVLEGYQDIMRMQL